MRTQHTTFSRSLSCCLTMSVVIWASALTASGQVASDGSGLFSPPPLNATNGAEVAHDGLLPLTTEQIGQDSINVPVTEPTNSSIPALVSTPGVANTFPANSVVENSSTPSLTVAPVESQAGTWGSEGSYQGAMSLWGGTTSAAPVQSYGYSTEPVAGSVPQFASANCGGESVCGETYFDSGIGRGWGRVDVLLWNLDGYATPALVTRAPGNVVQNGSGALGGNGTQILFGNQELGNDLRFGGRMEFGRWIDRTLGVGLQADFFGLSGGTQSTVFTGNNADIHARPFFNTNPYDVNSPDGLVFSMPGIAQGSAQFDLSSEVLSAGTTFRININGNHQPQSHQVDFLLGYRFFRLEETFVANSTLGPDDPTINQGRLELRDRVRTRNDFHGVELGISHALERGAWGWNLAALCALGEVERVVNLDGTTRVVTPGGNDDTFPGAFFSGPSDVGQFRDQDFAAIPQVRANMSYCLSRNCRLSVGYNVVYLSSAFRPGQFLNTTFDGSRLVQDVIVGTARPSVRRDDMLLHGANVGLSYSF